MNLLRSHLVELWQSPVIRGFSFMSLMRYSTKGMSLLRLVIVARLLGSSAPYELGTFGLALLVIAVTEVFTQTGINIILIRSQKTLDKYLDTAWIISIVRGFIISLAIYWLTPYLVSIFDNPDITTYLHWALLVPILRGFINPAIIRYQQTLAFGHESLFRVSLQLIDILSGLIFVFLAGSAIGLIWGVVVGVAAEVILSFILFRPCPAWWKFKLSLLWPLFSETKYVIVNGIVTYLNENLDDLIIARLLGTSGLGFYQMAYKLSSAVTIEIGNTLRDTLYPVYAKLVNKPLEMAKLIDSVQWRLLNWNVLVILPGFILAGPVIRLLLGEDWLRIVSAVQILLISGALRGMMNSWFPVFILSDHVRINFLINSASTLIMVVGLYLLIPHLGLQGSAMAILLSVAVVAPLMWQAKTIALQKLVTKYG